MARIAGVDLPREKAILYALPLIYGIGRNNAARVIAKAEVDPAKRVKDLDEAEVARIREVIEADCTVEGDLRREINSNIRRLIEIGSYRGHRHRRGLPTRGQRTRSNARQRKGPRKTVAGRKKIAAKK
jgi:small subunit ribosomal protein S13